MTRFLLSIILLSSVFTSLQASELIGEYRAVTETEINITLDIQSDANALLTSELYAIEDGDDEWVEIIKGNWKLKESKLVINFDSGKVIEYEIFKCLSYDEFDYKGCSYGIKPSGGTLEKDHVLFSYGLWKSKEIEKLWE